MAEIHILLILAAGAYSDMKDLEVPVWLILFGWAFAPFCAEGSVWISAFAVLILCAVRAFSGKIFRSEALGWADILLSGLMGACLETGEFLMALLIAFALAVPFALRRKRTALVPFMFAGCAISFCLKSAGVVIV